MRHKLFIIGLFFSSVLLLPNYVFAQEAIRNFSGAIIINPDASVKISEEINYDFALESRHGIYRDIPLRYQARGGNYNLRFIMDSITDENANKYLYSTSNLADGIRIKIGDSDIFVTGQKYYQINYQIKRAINYFSDHDEFYWNFTGNSWNVPILQAEASVVLPENVKSELIQVDCFIGILGSKQQCQSKEVFGNAATFKAQNLAAGEGLTIIVGFPKGTVIQQTKWQNFAETTRDNWIIFLPIVIFFLCYFIWFKYGRDPKPLIPVVAQYESPDNLSPAECDYILNEHFSKSFLTAEIIQLAVNGYIKIKHEMKKGFLGFAKEDFRIIRLKDISSITSQTQKQVFEIFFKNSASEILLSELDNKSFATNIETSKSEIKKGVIGQGYFPNNPLVIRSLFITPVVLLSILGLIISVGRTINIISILISAIVALFFAYLMSKRTQKGSDTRQQILGLKLYIATAEQDRINFHNAPEKNPELFEKLLPYAIVFGLSKVWSKAFEKIYTKNPNWYSDPSNSLFNALILNNALNSFSSNVSSTYNHSASTGGSGFGGGGFSGGGFGGGGGGSW
jgi:uncharacterized membrane protein